MCKLKVYYNSACPVCDAGIQYQRRKLVSGDAQVQWIDVHADNDAASAVNRDLEFVRKRLHVIDEQGTLHVGMEAFAELWSRTPRQKYLAKFARAPGLRWILQGLYNGFAALLYRWNRLNRRW